MKLRLRCLESSKTLRIEVPDPCSISQLRQILVSHPDFPSGVSQSDGIRFSLNRKDELRSSSPDDSLRSLGVTSGDLIFFTANPSAFSASEMLGSHLGLQGNIAGSSSSGQGDGIREKGGLSVGSGSSKAGVSDEFGGSAANSKSSDEAGSDGGAVNHGAENMDVDVDGSAASENKFSQSNFLKKVLKEEMGDGAKNHKLLVISVHAVFVEAGFVAFDQGPSSNFTMSLSYTVPELLENGTEGVESVTLKFQSMRHFVNVYGALSKGGSGTYRICLDEKRFSSAIDAMWMSSQDVNENHEKKVFEFWKTVKDGLVLPLLIDLCEKAGLSPPPCLMRLPMELKLKILENLPGIDIAKVACVCSEFQFLSSNSDLWKMKYAEEFGSGSGGLQETMNWKEKFASAMETKKRMVTAIVPWQEHALVSGPIRRPHRFPRIIRDPEPHRWFPQGIGGDYDRFPGIRFPFGFGRRGPGGGGGFFMRRNFSPSCNLGGFNA